MIQKQLSGYGVMCLIFLAVCSASPLKQSRLQRQLDKLDIKTRRENLLRREEINGLYTIMERIEERINNTLPNVDKSIDKAKIAETQAGIVTVDDVRITEILKEVYYLKRGFMDEKKLTSRFRGQVVQLNNTMSQLMLQMGQRMQAMSAFNGALDETKINLENLVLGQNELKTFINTIQDDLERQANETKQLLQNMEMKLEEPTRETAVHKEREYSSCVDLMENGIRVSGVYDITLPHADSVKVYCDQTTDGGGWTVFQRRQDGSVDFERTWQEYKDGFGQLKGEFWLGNDKIHRLFSLKDSYELRIDLIDHHNNAWYAQYANFMVGSEGQDYMLTVEDFSGTAGDALWYHNQMKFSAKDSDNDMDNKHCAVVYKGGWWYNYCHWANLNGVYFARDNTGVRWYTSGKGNIFLKVVEMKFREV